MLGKPERIPLDTAFRSQQTRGYLITVIARDEAGRWSVKPFRHATAMPECFYIQHFCLGCPAGGCLRPGIGLSRHFAGESCFVSATTTCWLWKPHDLSRVLVAACSAPSMIIVHTQLGAHVINFLFHRDVLLLLPGEVVAR
jgi:hypothetical protein